MTKQLLQIIGPPGCGKTCLIQSFSQCVVPVDYLLCTPWSGFLDVPGRPTYLFQERVRPEHFRKLLNFVRADELHIEQKMKEPYFIKNNGIWVYEGIEPLDVQPSLIWEVSQYD